MALGGAAVCLAVGALSSTLGAVQVRPALGEGGGGPLGAVTRMLIKFLEAYGPVAFAGAFIAGGTLR